MRGAPSTPVAAPMPTAPAPATKRRRVIRELNLDIRLPPCDGPLTGRFDCSQTLLSAYPSAIVWARRPEDRSYTNDLAILHQPRGESTLLRPERVRFAAIEKSAARPVSSQDCVTPWSAIDS